MTKTQLLLKRKWLPACSVLLLYILSIFTNVAYAVDAKKMFQSWLDQGWHPVGSIGLGGYITSNAGNSQNFPILDPITDAYYNYSASQTAQKAAFISLFLGNEWLLADRDWLMQTGLEYSETTGLSVHGDLTQGADVGSQNFYTYKYNITTRQLLLSAKILYTIQQIYHPYVYAGLGPAVNRAANYKTTVPPDLTFTQEYRTKSTTSFSWGLGFGLDVEIHEKLRLGIGYRFTNLGQVSLGSANIDTISVPGTLTQSHLYANEVIAQLTMVL
jgi:opacity protein-like surface antigen